MAETPWKTSRKVPFKDYLKCLKKVSQTPRKCLKKRYYKNLQTVFTRLSQTPCKMSNHRLLTIVYSICPTYSGLGFVVKNGFRSKHFTTISFLLLLQFLWYQKTSNDFPLYWGQFYRFKGPFFQGTLKKNPISINLMISRKSG